MVTLRKKTIKSITSTKRWTAEEQSHFLFKVADLLHEGFSLAESLHLLEIMMLRRQADIQTMLIQMEQGDSFPSTLSSYGFTETITVQLQLALLNGNFVDTMAFCAEEITTRHKQTLQLKKITAYPLFLLFLSFCMLLAIRQFMLPTIQYSVTTSSAATVGLMFFLTYFPQITLGGAAIVSTTLLIGKKMLDKQTVLGRAIFYCRIPVIGSWIQDFYSFFFSREFAYFILNGQSIYHMLEEMQASHCTSLMQEVAQEVETALRQGQTFPETIAAIPIFKPEMTWMIYHGEKTSQLGLKLKLFSQECHRQFFQNLSKKINLLQPVLFLLIGLFIIVIYLILMLPMLDMMKGVF